MTHAACSILSKNYLAFARVLARSYLEHHPDGRFFVLLVDRLEDAFRPEEECFTLIEVEELTNVPDLRSLLFKYNQLEANTAVKPFLLEHLFRRFELEHLVYLDPDIQVYQRFRTLEPLLERHSIVLVPHLTAPIDDEHKPSELDILLAGTYNLGFIGLKRTETTLRFLDWWQKRLQDRCVIAFEQGIFVDQRWIDLVPGMFQDVAILTEPGYDVAYWNLHERKVTAGDPPRVNGEPLYFFHFSGIQLDRLEHVSKHQGRFVLSEIGDAAGLYRAYRKLLLAAGHERSSVWRYAFGYYDDGRPITDAERSAYLALGKRRARFGDPFDTSGPAGYRAWFSKRSATSPAPARVWGWLRRSLKQAYQSAPGGFARRSARRVLGAERTLAIWLWGRRWRDRALGAANQPARLPAPKLELESGIDLTGYLRAETGVGEACRSLVRALRTADIPLDLHDVDLNVRARKEDHSLGPVGGAYSRRTHILYVNADQVGEVSRHLGPQPFEGRYRIGCWVWESTHFPDEWLPAFAHFDEIWAPSTFCVDVISSVSPIPVRRVPYPILPAGGGGRGRDHFGLPPDSFLFLFAFDFLSVWERKNPLAAIRAFRAAFSRGEDVHLVLKSSNSDFDLAGRERIARELEGLPVTWIDRTLDREEVNDLFRCCDCYVSLHRSEGFGLTIAEAMFLGKPVIATAWSGNVDFFGINNGWPVRYRLVELEAAVGPYAAGSLWAEPEVEHAAQQMRLVYEDVEERQLRVARARADVQEQLSHRAIGALVERLYRDIGRRLGG